MNRRIIPIVAILLIAASPAYAQYGGGMGGGGGGHRGGGRRQQPPPDSSAPASAPAPPTRRTPTGKVPIIGVVKAIDLKGQRITIAYDEVDSLNWPAGVMPFAVEKTSLLDGVSVGEKVRFNVESQQISALEPYTPPRPDDDAQ
jgi:Cu/Ag efflux protein CusF